MIGSIPFKKLPLLPLPIPSGLVLGKKLSGLMILVLLWEILPMFHLVDPRFLPPFSSVLSTFIELWGDGTFQSEIAITLRRALTSYLLATVCAVPLGVLIGWKKILYDSTAFVIDGLRSIPSVAMIPIFLLFFGPGSTTIQAIIFWGVFFLQIISTIYGTQQVDQTLIESMQSIGMGQYRFFKDIFLPASLPGIVIGMRQTISVMVILTIVAEMLLATNGMGNFIMRTQRNFQIESTYAGVLLIGLLGFILNKIFVYMQNKILFWTERKTVT